MKLPRIILRENPNLDYMPVGNAPATVANATPTDNRMTMELEQMSSEEAAREARHSDVLAIAPDMPTLLLEPVLTNASFESDPVDSPNTWGLHAIGALDSTLGGSDIKVAVLDTGINRDHPAFQNAPIVEADFSGDGNGDTNGHGTHCAGTIFGGDVEGKRIGIARDISEALVGKVLGNNGKGGTIATLQGMNWAIDRGANVISMSLGIDFPGYRELLVNAYGYPENVATSMALEGFRANLVAYQAVAKAVAVRSGFGVSTIVVAASGNESRREENDKWVISAGIPSATRGIIAVGAVGKTNAGLAPAPFSNTGVNISGPGVNIESAAVGGQGLISFNGTSMATPHVAGAACLWAQWLKERAQLSPMNLTSKLISSATTTDIVPNTQPGDIGLGIVQAPI